MPSEETVVSECGLVSPQSQRLVRLTALNVFVARGRGHYFREQKGVRRVTAHNCECFPLSSSASYAWAILGEESVETKCPFGSLLPETAASHTAKPSFDRKRNSIFRRVLREGQKADAMARRVPHALLGGEKKHTHN